jgi:hypothetical protein
LIPPKRIASKNSQQLANFPHLGKGRPFFHFFFGSPKKDSCTLPQVQKIRESLLCNETPEDIARERCDHQMPEDEYPEASVKKKAEKLHFEMKLGNSYFKYHQFSVFFF